MLNVIVFPNHFNMTVSDAGLMLSLSCLPLLHLDVRIEMIDPVFIAGGNEGTGL